MMNLLVSILLAVISVTSVAFEVLYYKEKARRRDEELMYLEHRERWLEICERQKKKIEELEDKIVLYKDQEEILLRRNDLDLERVRLFPF